MLSSTLHSTISTHHSSNFPEVRATQNTYLTSLTVVPEIRNAIYELCLENKEVIIRYKPHVPLNGPSHIISSRSLAHMSRQTRHEFLKIYHHNTKFRIYITALKPYTDVFLHDANIASPLTIDSGLWDLKLSFEEGGVFDLTRLIELRRINPAFHFVLDLNIDPDTPTRFSVVDYPPRSDVRYFEPDLAKVEFDRLAMVVRFYLQPDRSAEWIEMNTRNEEMKLKQEKEWDLLYWVCEIFQGAEDFQDFLEVRILPYGDEVGVDIPRNVFGTCCDF